MVPGLHREQPRRPAPLAGRHRLRLDTALRLTQAGLAETRPAFGCWG
jgi:hypothetical protein